MLKALFDVLPRRRHPLWPVSVVLMTLPAVGFVLYCVGWLWAAMLNAQGAEGLSPYAWPAQLSHISLSLGFVLGFAGLLLFGALLWWFRHDHAPAPGASRGPEAGLPTSTVEGDTATALPTGVDPGPRRAGWVGIAAMAANRAIGLNGVLPWKIPDEFKHFQETTRGHILLMGRRTWEEIGGIPLPHREHWVVSKTMAPVPGCRLLGSIEEALSLPTEGRTVFVAGGSGIYAGAQPYCAEMLISHLPDSYEADTFFPPFEAEFPVVETVREHPQFTIRRYRRSQS